MSATITTSLQPFQKAQIQSMNPAFPVDDAELFAIYELDGSIRSATAFLNEGDDTYECYAFTDQKYRRQGLFTELLDLAIETLPEDSEFLFYTNGTDPDTMAVLDVLEAECVLQEHMMEIDLSTWKKDQIAHQETSITMTCSTVEDTLTRHYKNSYGSVNISVFASYYYLYGLEIHEKYRGQGHGNRLLCRILHDLAVHGPLPLRLQVSGANIPAVSLYKKTGFQITETLFGYLY